MRGTRYLLLVLALAQPGSAIGNDVVDDFNRKYQNDVGALSVTIDCGEGTEHRSGPGGFILNERIPSLSRIKIPASDSCSAKARKAIEAYRSEDLDPEAWKGINALYCNAIEGWRLADESKPCSVGRRECKANHWVRDETRSVQLWKNRMHDLRESREHEISVRLSRDGCDPSASPSPGAATTINFSKPPAAAAASCGSSPEPCPPGTACQNGVCLPKPNPARTPDDAETLKHLKDDPFK